MDPDLLLQNHILPPALSEQMALHRLRKRKHSHCQRGVLHSLRLRHYVEQSHRTVSLLPPPSRSYLLAVCIISCLVLGQFTHIQVSMKSRQMCLQRQCVQCTGRTVALPLQSWDFTVLMIESGAA